MPTQPDPIKADIGQVLENKGNTVIVIMKNEDGTFSVDAGEGEQRIESVSELLSLIRSKCGGESEEEDIEQFRRDTATDVYDDRRYA